MSVKHPQEVNLPSKDNFLRHLAVLNKEVEHFRVPRVDSLAILGYICAENLSLSFFWSSYFFCHELLVYPELLEDDPVSPFQRRAEIKNPVLTVPGIS